MLAPAVLLTVALGVGGLAGLTLAVIAATGCVSVARRTDLGVQPVVVDSIVGTVEEEKARAFDHRFRPPARSREHWERLWLAHAGALPLPPIAVYRVGDEHFVRDGHHRVSVALGAGRDEHRRRGRGAPRVAREA